MTGEQELFPLHDIMGGGKLNATMTVFWAVNSMHDQNSRR